MFINTRKVQAVRSPRTLREFLIYATTLSTFTAALNLIVLAVVVLLVLFYTTNDTIKQNVRQWQAVDDRLMSLDHIPDNTSEACYMTLIKRLQTTTDVREDGTVEISEVVWSEPSPDCSRYGQF